MGKHTKNRRRSNTGRNIAFPKKNRPYWGKYSCNLHNSGAREVGGARDGVGNTCKVVTDGDAGFGLLGGNYSFDGDYYPVAGVSFIDDTDFTYNNGSGVVVLNKVRSTEH